MREPGGGVVSIPELRPGETVEGFFAVMIKDLRPFRDPGKGAYLHLKLRNRTGFIEARVWDRAEELAEVFEEGDPLWVTAEVNNYRGTNQLIVGDLAAVDPAEVTPEHFLPESPRPLEVMEGELWTAIEALPRGPVSRLLVEIFGNPEFYQAYTRAPAAKRVHHAYLSGLLEHSLEVLTVLTGGTPGGDRLDMEILTAGALLHDVGKIEEYEYRVDIDYSPRGRLIGHIALGYRMVDRWIAAFPDFPGDLATHLGHLLLSHHGEHAYGAPVLPQTAEAVALHHADILSGKVGQALAIGDGIEPGAWSDYDRLLGRYMWSPPRPGDAEPEG